MIHSQNPTKGRPSSTCALTGKDPKQYPTHHRHDQRPQALAIEGHKQRPSVGHKAQLESIGSDNIIPACQ